MKELAEKIQTILESEFPKSFVRVRVDSTFGNESICIRFSLQPKEKWSNGIFQNAHYSISFVWKRGNDLFSYEQSSGYMLKHRNKNYVNEDKLIQHIAREFAKLKEKYKDLIDQL